MSTFRPETEFTAMRRRSLVSALAALPAAPLLAQSAAPAISLQLPAKPSVLLEAPVGDWLPLLNLMSGLIEGELAKPEGITRGRLVETRIAQTLIVQGREQWSLVRAAAERARRVQEAESGRLTAGLINELLAAQRLGRHDSAWLRQATADRFAAMPWETVGGVVRGLHQQLTTATAEGLRLFVRQRLDLSSDVSKGQVSLGFALQLLGARLQLLHVLPQRDALLAGLGAVLSRHPADAPSTTSPPAAAQPASS